MGIMAKTKRNIKKRNNKNKSFKKIFNHLKLSLNNLKKIGGNCTVNNQIPGNTGCNTSGLSTCIPNVNVEQYKSPCSFLPLDGTKHNVYPLSHNPSPGPPYGISTGGKRASNKGKKNKNKTKNKKGGNSYLSVNNDTSAYTRYGAPGKCCGPNWRYSSIKAGKNKKRNKRTNKKKTKKGGGVEKSFTGQVWYGIESYPDDPKMGVSFVFGSHDQGRKYVKVPGYISGTYKRYIQKISDKTDCSPSCPTKKGEDGTPLGVEIQNTDLIITTTDGHLYMFRPNYFGHK